MLCTALHRNTLFFSFCLLVATSACTVRADSGTTPARANAAVQQEKEQEPVETVRIGDIDYPVPRQWQGQKVEAEQQTPALPLVAVPRKLAKNGAAIYLRRDARDALEAMADRALADNVTLRIDSGYRSSRYQKKIIERQLEKGKSFQEISRFVAPPGYSEHRLGTAVDFSPSNWRFASTPQYRWLLEHAGQFGFTQTYPENGPRHPWEPWHWRFRPSLHSATEQAASKDK